MTALRNQSMVVTGTAVMLTTVVLAGRRNLKQVPESTLPVTPEEPD